MSRREAAWPAALAGFGLGTLLAAWPMLLDALIGALPAVRSAALALTLLAIALGGVLSTNGRGRQLGSLTGPLALVGAAVGALVWRGGDGSTASGLAGAALAVLPASIAIGAALPGWVRARSWLAGLGAGVALGALIVPRLGIPLTIVLAAVTLVAGGLRRAEREAGPIARSGHAAATIAIAALGAGLVVVGVRLAAEVSRSGAGATRAALAAGGIALLITAAVPARTALRGSMLVATAGAWWLAALLVGGLEPTIAATPGDTSTLWLTAAGLVAVPAALTARGLVGLVDAGEPRLVGPVVGTAIGLAIVVHALVPAIGPLASAALLALLLLAAALAAASRTGTGDERSMPLLAGAVLLALIAFGVGVLWRPLPTTPDARALDTIYGPRATATLWEHERDPALRWMTVNGLTIGQTYGGLDTVQQLLAHLPFALHTASPPRRVLLVGHGLGVVASEVRRHESVDELVVVEPNAAISELATRASGADGDRQPRIVRADPWGWLQQPDDPAPFDAVIVAGQLLDPGVDDDRLWTAEFYRRCRERAGDDGVVVRPIPLDLDPRELSIAVRSFTTEFDHVQAWLSPPTHAILAGSATATSLDLQAIDELFRGPALANLRRYGWSNGATLISMLSADEARLAELVGNAARHTLPRRTLAGVTPPGEDDRRVRRAGALARFVALRPALPDWPGLAGYDVPAIEAHHAAASRLIETYAVLARRETDAIAPALDALRQSFRAAPTHGLVATAINAIVPLAAELTPGSAGAREALGERLIASGEPRRAEQELREALRLDPRRATSFALLGRALAMQGNYHGAAIQFDNALAFGLEDRRTRFELAVALRLSGERERAAAAIAGLLESVPNDPAALEQRALLLLGGEAPSPEDLRQALADAELAVRASGARQPGTLHTLALALDAVGQREAAVRSATRALETARAIGARALEPQLLATLARLRASGASGDPTLGKPEPGT